MKTAATTAIVLSAAAAMANPQRQHGLPEGTKVDCSKPNANFCMGDIILRCDENAVGTPGRCSDNVSGYPPAGGVATCYESDRLAGDAACMKNCVVYAEPSYTLPADKCDPSVIPSGLQETPTQDAGTTGMVTVPIIPAPTEDAGTTGIITIPEGTGSAWPPGPSTSLPSVIIDPIPSEYLTNSTKMPEPTSSGPVVQPTGAAPANQAMGGLAIAGIVAAYLV